MCGINYDSVQNAILNANSVNIMMSGNEYVLDKSNEHFGVFIDFVEKVLSDSRSLPALGVSLHDEVENEKKSKNWVEFNFAEKSQVEGMTFDSLLVFVEKDMGGINIYRKNDGKYDGRCFYIDLSDSMAEVFRVLG